MRCAPHATRATPPRPGGRRARPKRTGSPEQSSHPAPRRSSQTLSMHQRGSKREGCTGLPIRRHARKAAATDLEATRASGERGAVAQIERPAISRPPGVTPHPVCLGLRASHASGPPAQAILKSALRLAQLVERVRPVGQGSGPIDDMRSIGHYKQTGALLVHGGGRRATIERIEGF